MQRRIVDRLEQQEGIPVFSTPEKQIIVEELDGTETLLPIGTPAQQARLRAVRLECYNDLDPHNPALGRLRKGLASVLHVHPTTLNNSETPFEDE